MTEGHNEMLLEHKIYNTSNHVRTTINNYWKLDFSSIRYDNNDINVLIGI